MIYGIPFADEEDIECMLTSSICVVLDVGGPKHLLQAFMEKFVPDTQPVVLVAMGAGSNERKLKLAMELLEKCSPAVICGRSIDLNALGEVVSEKYDYMGGDQDDQDDTDPVVSDESRNTRLKASPYLKTRKLHKTRSPSPGRKMRDAAHKVCH